MHFLLLFILLIDPKKYFLSLTSYHLYKIIGSID